MNKTTCHSSISSQTALWTIIIIITINAIGTTIVFPILPFLIGKYLPNSQIAVGISSLAAVYTLCQFFAAPLLGALSDRFGRKPILVTSLLGSAIGYILFGIGGALWVLFLGRIIDGVTAGDISTLTAYIADSTEKQERAKWFGYVGAAMGIGLMIGPAIGGFLGTISTTLPFFITGGITLIITIFSHFFLPESLAIEKRINHLSVEQFNIFVNFKNIFIIKTVRRMLIIGAFFLIGLTIFHLNICIFVKDIFDFGPGYIGIMLMLVGACDIISRAFFLPQLLKKFNEKTIAQAGLVGLTIGMCIIFLSAYITNSILLMTAIGILVISEGLFDPSYNAELSSAVDENKQGVLQGVNRSLQAIYQTIVPLVTAGIYIYNHSAVFVIATIFMFLALVTSVRFNKNPILNNTK
ncbi:MAG: MFS transporter [Candidatus Babeliales bacterium]